MCFIYNVFDLDLKIWSNLLDSFIHRSAGLSVAAGVKIRGFKNSKKNIKTNHLITIFIFIFMNEGIASIPNIKTPAPVIYLEDNLGEKDQLGYCIDTKGRGFGEKLHAHSCKPRGGDVQFRYDS